jgi:hypothetical protein
VVAVARNHRRVLAQAEDALAAIADDDERARIMMIAAASGGGGGRGLARPVAVDEDSRLLVHCRGEEGVSHCHDHCHHGH